MRVREVVDGEGEVRTCSAKIEGGHPEVAVGWQRGHLGEHLKKKASLRFRLRQARLYSSWLE